MKKTTIILLFLLVASQMSQAQGTVVKFLDIQGLDGEYITPSRTKFTTQNPKPLNILLNSYDFSWAAETSFDYGSGAAVGKPNEIGEMTFRFQIDKSVVGLYQRLVNNTRIPEMDIFIDKPGLPLGANQTELSRIKLFNVIIKNLSMTNDEIPQYSMKVRFEKVSMIIHTFNNLGAGTKGEPYCFEYLTAKSNENCFAF